MTKTTKTTPDPLTTFRAWLARGRARLAPLCVHRSPAGDRTVHATAPIRAGEAVVTVPRELLVTREVALASPIGRALARRGVELDSSHSLLAAFLVDERQDGASPWRPYLDVLPRSWRRMPMFYARHELAWLRGSHALSRRARQKRSFVADYERLCGAAPAFARHGARAFFEARMSVLTRVFGVVLNGVKTDAMVPFADLLDHARRPETTWAFDDSLDAFVVTAVHDLAAGAEVHDSYGRKSNARFLVNYGFCLERNDSDEAVLHFETPRSDAARAQIARWLPGLGLDGGHVRFQVPADAAHGDVRALFTFLRLACADDADRAHLPAARGAALRSISTRNERAALALLSHAAHAALARFDTTAAEDDLALAPLSRNARNCVLVRRGEKRVLRCFAGLAADAVPLLSLAPAALVAALRDVPPADSLSAGYFATLLPPAIASARTARSARLASAAS